mgnify:CR=1 FL=1|jgi:hypothetical protein
MPEAVLKFDLEEESLDFQCATNGFAMYQVLKNYQKELINRIKHTNLSNDVETELEYQLQRLNEEIQGNDLETLFK